MAIDIAELERLIKDGIPNAQVWIEDLRGDGDHCFAGILWDEPRPAAPDGLQGLEGEDGGRAPCPRLADLGS
jgi:hypothetical protein